MQTRLSLFFLSVLWTLSPFALKAQLAGFVAPQEVGAGGGNGYLPPGQDTPLSKAGLALDVVGAVTGLAGGLAPAIGAVGEGVAAGVEGAAAGAEAGSVAGATAAAVAGTPVEDDAGDIALETAMQVMNEYGRGAISGAEYAAQMNYLENLINPSEDMSLADVAKQTARSGAR